MNQNPPKLAQQLLKWYAGKADMEDLHGDLDECYGLHLKNRNIWSANLNYWKQVISLLFSYTIRKRKNNAQYSNYYGTNSTVMLKNYIKIAFRNLKKQKAFTLISVFGLSIGMSIALLAVAMYIDLIQFDTYHDNAEDIYRVVTEVKHAGNKERYSSSPPALTNRMENEIPSIYKSVHIDVNFSALLDHNRNNIRIHGYFTEPSFFEMFAFELESGSPDILYDPGKVIITKELAEKLYGEQEALGQIIQTERWGPMEIAGVLKSFPKQTHLAFEVLTSFNTSQQFNASYRTSEWTDFTSNYYYFASDETEKDLITRINKIGNSGSTVFEKEDMTTKYDLQALLDITPGEMINDGIGVQFDMPTMLLFFGISLLILVPACFNYTNMSIALALKRAKEVGIRKVMGSHRKQIIYQFLVETVIICLFSVVLSAFVFYQLRAGFVSSLAGGSSISFEVSPALIVAFIGFAILTGILTGLGPAVYFAKITPIQALRSTSSEKISISGIRKGLLVFQFALTLVFMIGIGVLLKQYQESKSFELPFSTENTFIVYMQGTDADLFRNQLANEASIANVSFSSSIPGTSLTRSRYIYDPEIQDSLRYREVFVDDRFIDHMNLSLLSGAVINNQEHQLERVVINKEMMSRLKLIKFSDTTQLLLKDGSRVLITGVLDNYNHEPLNESIEPMMMRYNKNEWSYAIVTVPDGTYLQNFHFLEDKWDNIHSNIPFKATLLENEIYEAYHFLRVGIKIFGFLAMLAVSISCLGLLGMVIYSTENRIKEVAIRKILGASRKSLYGSLAGLFIKLWSIALIIAIPLSYLFYDNFLVRLYNKYTDGVGMIEIILSVGVTLLLGGFTIFWQVNKISKVNPADNLRYE